MEFLAQISAAGNTLTLFTVQRLISMASERSGIAEADLEILSHSAQTDMARVILAGLSPDHLNDPFINPMKRVKGWRSILEMPVDEIRIETPRGACRIFQLSAFAVGE